MRFDKAVPPHTLPRHTKHYKKAYWVNPAEVDSFTARKLVDLDSRADQFYVRELNILCQEERDRKEQLKQDAQGWFGIDKAKWQEANNMPAPNCQTLLDLQR